MNRRLNIFKVGDRKMITYTFMSEKINKKIEFLFNVLVSIARRVHLFPFRTQKLSFATSMVLRGFTWESR